IHQHQINAVLPEQFHRLFAVVGFDDTVAIILENPAQQFAVGVCVVHHQNFHGLRLAYSILNFLSKREMVRIFLIWGRQLIMDILALSPRLLRMFSSMPRAELSICSVERMSMM